MTIVLRFHAKGIRDGGNDLWHDIKMEIGLIKAFM
jgi:hypothetical protein